MKSNQTVLIHIGKCGGSTVAEEFRKNTIEFLHKHVCKVDYCDNEKYIILIRNPISRFISAFNWRYLLVCEKELSQNLKTRNRQLEIRNKINEKGVLNEKLLSEIRILDQYKTVNNLAEDIYTSKGYLKIDFSKPEYHIGHITQDINFYLGEFLHKCDKKNIISVIATENLDEDLKNFFNIDRKSWNHDNKRRYSTYLSELGYKNLKKYLRKDYECIKKLYDLNLISKEKHEILTK